MSNRLNAAIPYLFVVLALISTLFLAMNTPPFMGAGEPAHAARAASPRALLLGRPGNPAVLAAEAAFRPIAGDRTRKADAADYAAAPLVPGGAPATGLERAGGAPFLYLPAAGGFALARLLGWPVVQSLYLARMANAVACVAIGFTALLLAGRARLLFFALLLLPMSSFLYATVTPEGLMVALTALGCAVVAGAMAEGRPLSWRDLLASAVPLAIVGMAAPPYAVLALLLLAAPAEKALHRIAAAFVPLVLAVPWLLAAARDGALVPPNPGGASANFYAKSFVGLLGRLDTPLPLAFHYLARLMLLLALALSLSRAWPKGWGCMAWAAPLAALAAIAAVFALPAAADGSGVTGRHLIPMALALALAAVGGPPLIERAPERWRLVAMGVVLAFPLLSALVVERAVVLRYYLD